MLFLFALCFTFAFSDVQEFKALCQQGRFVENSYPQDGVCNIADEGPYCVGPASHGVADTYYCGCQVDGDCFSIGVFPTCLPETGSLDGSGICDSCRVRGDGTDLSKGSNSFCRLRYPSVDFFLNDLDETLYQGENIDGDVVPAFPVSDEKVPIYREFCANAGGCKPCNEASDGDAVLPSVFFPEYQGNTLGSTNVVISSLLDASLKGSYFCHEHSVYAAGDGTMSRHDDGSITADYSFRPICSSFDSFSALGLSGERSRDVEEEWGLSGVEMNSMDIADGANTVALIQSSYNSYIEEKSPKEWNGACMPCQFKNPEGVMTEYHGLCYMAFNDEPICKNGNCVQCETNAQCAMMTDPVTCWTDKTGSCTGTGFNCYEDGHCGDCRIEGCPASGSGVDGGNEKVQLQCRQSDGVCENAPPPWVCDGNDLEGGDFACSNSNSATSTFTDKPNCQANGDCVRCSITRSTSSTNRNDAVTNCGFTGNTDGPPNLSSGQVNCQTGVTNGDRLQHTCIAKCTNGDPLAQQFCEGTQGANCMKDGICLDCNSDADCVANDLGDHPICNDDKICEADFFCNGNQGSGTDKACGTTTETVGEENCQEDGACLKCSVRRTNPSDVTFSSLSSTCDGLDGPPGDTANQKNCQVSSGTCVAQCTSSNGAPSDTYCSNLNPSQPNCMDNGVCLTCHSDADCEANDMGGQTKCESDGICYAPFSCDGNIDDSSAKPCTVANVGASHENCQKTGQCERCSVSRSSTNCGNLDGVGGGDSDQRNCQVQSSVAGRQQHTCIDACTNGNYLDQTFCIGTQGANCMSDGRCFDCLSDDDCKDNDMGGHELCDQDSKICTPACSADFGNDCTSGNCMDDGRCRICDSNDDCKNNDGPPSNPGLHEECKSDGVCRFPFCLSNAECAGNVDGPNCGTNGRCYDCRDSDETCGVNADGPDQITGHIGDESQPNCDSGTGICVYYCTEDADCVTTHKFTDSFNHPCEPFCNIDRGCCVECNSDSDCPHTGMDDGKKLGWRGDEASYTQCSENHICVKPFSDVCDTDSDCPSERPACSNNEQQCVECTSDSHCDSSSGFPACSTGAQKCVECTLHDHCPEGYCVGGGCVECIHDSNCVAGDVCRGNTCTDGDDSDSAIQLTSICALFVTILTAFL